MIKIWILTVIFTTRDGGISSEQYQFKSQNDCYLARDYMVNIDYKRSRANAICLQTDLIK